ncbi:MAG: hypothetical protein B7X60_01135, partial [Polynucleobacter sp. 39-45-136]
MALIVLVAFLCFFQRLTMVWNQNFPFDSWGHLYFIVSVKRQRTGPFKPIWTDVVGGGYYHYPLLTHWFISLLPESILISRWVKVLNPIFEGVALLFCMLLSLWAGISPVTVSASGLLYIFTPMIFSKVGIGPTSYFSTRLYSELSTGMLLLLTFLPLPLDRSILILLVGLLVSYIALSSKFGLQMLFLVIIPAAFLSQKFYFLLAIIIGLTFSIFISKGVAIKIWREQWNHLLWYLSKVKTMPISDRNSFLNFKKAFSTSGLKEKVKNIAFLIVGKNSFTSTILKFPILVAIPILLFNNNN